MSVVNDMSRIAAAMKIMQRIRKANIKDESTSIGTDKYITEMDNFAVISISFGDPFHVADKEGFVFYPECKKCNLVKHIINPSEKYTIYKKEYNRLNRMYREKKEELQ